MKAVAVIVIVTSAARVGGVRVDGVRIIQIMSADGWHVRAIVDPNDPKGATNDWPLVGWALCEDGDGTFVTGCVILDGDYTWSRVSEVFVDKQEPEYLCPYKKML